MSYILLRIVEGASVALYRHAEAGRAELLPTRRDLFNYPGGIGWGYGGSGAKNLSYAIAGKLFEMDNLSDNELRRRGDEILNHVISKSTLDNDAEHDLQVDPIKQLFP
ncbi:DUF6166 domain-containing protein [Xanthomonas hortorum pv. pelargonii]|uniref:DUF6166 domain-containing protein n=1 Tax=Xanthomonas hortorum TaxID=56454 RepID=UPI0021C94D25|nr:DUF6166 domain-containing protein [Xanthomonas hortorum]MCU1710223.1 hypothetical protein [Xanthomonas hortorum pv. pelargonii]WCI07341.1 hypothetical protein PML25_22345 [Xanthomonas hortorum pv. pelargonii]WOB33105.1 hypothetical protein NYR98_22360 [Xanthomonas hortorum pv. pelargonii]